MLFTNEGSLEDDIRFLESYGTACPDHARGQLEALLANLRKGAAAERFSTHVLNRHFARHKDHALIHNLRIPDGAGGFAQFDHLLLSRLSKTISIFESKAYAGKLTRNAHGEWAVYYGRNRVEIASPVQQARLQREALKAWLQDNGTDMAFPQIGVFVLVDPKTTIDRKNIDDAEPVYRTDNFYDHWLAFGGITPLKRLFSTGVDASGLQAIAANLARSHQPPSDNWLRHLGLPPIAEKPRKRPARLPVKVTTPHNGDQESSVRTTDGKDLQPCSGLNMRTIADGQIALRPPTGWSEDQRNELAELVKGRARWNPRYQNWITDPATAEEVAKHFELGSQPPMAAAAEH